ncbi:hypothetical protein IWQ61_003017 [Dispira simplex]|nr:hypothetical protein IWQ61_003017 [Dispira simplex]
MSRSPESPQNLKHATIALSSNCRLSLTQDGQLPQNVPDATSSPRKTHPMTLTPLTSTSLSDRRTSQQAQDQRDPSNTSPTARAELPDGNTFAFTDYLNNPGWSSRDISLNSIAGVLNNPLAKSTTHSRIHKSDLPMVPVTHYRRIRQSEFDSYLQKVGRQFEVYEQNRQHETENKVSSGLANPFPSPSVSNISQEPLGDRKGQGITLSLHDIPALFYQSDLNLADPNQFHRLCKSLMMFQLGRTSSNRKDATSPKVTPAFIMDAQESISQCLDLVEDHLTREITQRSDAFFNALSTLQGLHDETVRCIAEIHALRKVLASISELGCGTGNTLLRYRQRRQHLGQLREAVRIMSELRAVLDHVALLREQEDLAGALSLLCDAKDRLAGVAVATPHLPPGLLQANVFRDLYRELEESYHSITVTLQQRLPQSMLDILYRTLTMSEGYTVKDVMPLYSDEFPSLAHISTPPIDVCRPQIWEHIKPVFDILQRTGQLLPIFQQLQEPFLDTVNRILEELWVTRFAELADKRALPKPTRSSELSTAPVEESTQGNSGHQPWVAVIPTLTFDQFLEWQFQMYCTFITVTRYIDVVRVTLCRSMVQTTGDSPSPVSPSVEPALEELEELVDAMLHLSHVQCARAIGHRSEQNAQLDLKSFYRLYALSWAFIFEMESTTLQTCFGLRGTLISQSKAFLNHFHMERTKQLILLIENDQWSQKGVPIDFQQMVDRIVGSARLKPTPVTNRSSSPTNATPAKHTPTEDSRSPGKPAGANDGIPGRARSQSKPSRTVPPLLVLKIDSDNKNRSYPTDTAQRQPHRPSMESISSLLDSVDQDPWYADPELLQSYRRSSSTMGEAKDTQSCVVVQGQSFHVVGCSLMLLKLMIDYIQCAANVQILAADVLQRIVEIFKLFNSRTCQVILGAGAMRSAGLRNITAKHIALASQSLGLVITLLPFVRECLRQTLNTSHEGLLDEFDRILKDYKEHQSELHNKLVTIMTERAQFHGKTIQATDWDVKNANPKDFNPTPNMELLVKETKTLHKVLGKYLPMDILQEVMSSVLRMYTQKLSDHLRTVTITTVQGKQRLLGDIQYFVQRLSTMDHIEPPGNQLEVLVNNLSIAPKTSPPPLPIRSPAPGGS